MTLLLSHRENWYTTCFLVLYLHNSHRSLLISKKGDALVLSLCLWSLFQHPQPLERWCECKGTKVFHSCKHLGKFFFPDPLAPTSAGASGAYPSRLCECKGTTFLTSCKPSLGNILRSLSKSLTYSTTEIHISPEVRRQVGQASDPLPISATQISVLDCPQSGLCKKRADPLATDLPALYCGPFFPVEKNKGCTPVQPLL